MRQRSHIFASTLVQTAALCMAGAVALPAQAIGCDELRDSIDARIRANGGSNFSVLVVDAAASAPGQVVGSCEMGAKKVVHVRGAAAARPKSTGAAVITECDNGKVVTSGPCRP